MRKRKKIRRRRKAEREQRIIAIGVAAIAFLVAAILVFGYWQEYIVKPAEPIAIVGGVVIRTDTYQKMVRYRRFTLRNYLESLRARKAELDPTDEGDQFLIQYYDQLISQAKTQMASLPIDVLEGLIEEELIRQEAARRGIVVTREEVEIEIEEWFGYYRHPPTPSPTPITPTVPFTPTPTIAPMTKAQFNELYSAYMNRLAEEVGFTEEDFRKVFEAIVLRRKLWEAIAEEVPTEEEQVHIRQILVEKEEEALEVIERLEAGEDFVALAKEVSIDEATKEKGGDLDWFTRDGFGIPKEVVEVAFGLEVNQISEPISTTLGYHIIEVLGREERELDPFILQFRREEAFEKWLSEQRQSEIVKRYWSSDKVPPEKR